MVTVGHSLGSAIALVEAARFGDVDGLALSGFLAHASAPGAPELIASLQPARIEPRFADAPPGYLTTRAGTRGDLFYHLPGADPAAIAFDEATKDTVVPTEPGTLSAAAQPEIDSAIDVPVLLAVGEHDNLHCPSSCLAPDGPAFKERQHYPRVPYFETLVVPDAGHSINLHRPAGFWLDAVQEFGSRPVRREPRKGPGRWSGHRRPSAASGARCQLRPMRVAPAPGVGVMRQRLPLLISSWASPVATA